MGKQMPKGKAGTMKTKAKQKAKQVKTVDKKSKRVAPKAKAPLSAKSKTKVAPNVTAKASANQKVKEIVPGPYEEIKKILERQKQALLVEAGVILEHTFSPTNEVFPDWTDQASVETDQNCNLRLREREQHLLQKIDDAIDRIRENTFGLCEVCGGPISMKRLKARPVTTLCIECKTRQEIEEKMRQ